MQWKPHKSPFSRKKNSSGPLVSGSTCCCCCCILMPVGQLASEGIVKKITGHVENIWLQALFTFLMLIASCLIGGFVTSGFRSLQIGLLAGGLSYLGMLYAYSIKWVPIPKMEQRIVYVCAQFVISLVMAAIFAALSVGAVILVLKS